MPAVTAKDSLTFPDRQPKPRLGQLVHQGCMAYTPPLWWKFVQPVLTEPEVEIPLLAPGNLQVLYSPATQPEVKLSC